LRACQYNAARTIQACDVLITEVSATYWGYPAQILRPYAIAESPPKLYRQLYDMCERAFVAVTSILKPGCTARQIVDTVQLIDDEGFSIYSMATAANTCRRCCAPARLRMSPSPITRSRKK
jgi:Xaa-Pro aminopeptidase